MVDRADGLAPPGAARGACGAGGAVGGGGQSGAGGWALRWVPRWPPAPVPPGPPGPQPRPSEQSGLTKLAGAARVVELQCCDGDASPLTLEQADGIVPAEGGGGVDGDAAETEPDCLEIMAEPVAVVLD